MSGKDILDRVRRAVHVADSLHTSDAALAAELLHAAEHCREATKEFTRVLKQLRPVTAAGEAARAQLLQQLSDLDCGEKLLRSLFEAGGIQQSEIHTHTPPRQLQ